MKRYLTLGVCLVLGLLFVLLFSNTTSPLFPYSYTTDSSAYMLFGKSVAMGKIPYVDIWEMKGPAIFYIEALGFLLTTSKMGVCIIQMLCMWLTFFMSYKIYHLEFNHKASLWLILFTGVSLVINYQGGNFIEEFTLPLLGLSTYFLYKWSLEPKHDGRSWHDPRYAVVYGVVLGFSLMTRLTDALGICGAVLVIFIYLLIYQQWRNLFLNALYFLGGFFAVVLPFCIYFYAHDALYEMWYGTFIFNLSYTAESTVGGITDLSSLKGFLVAFVNSYALFFVGLAVLLLNPTRRLAATMWMLMGGLLFLWYINSNGYGHYGMLALFSTCIILNEVHALMKVESTKKRLAGKAIGTLYVMFIAFFGFWGCLSQYQNRNLRFDEYDVLAELTAMVPEKDKDVFVAYSVNPSVYHIGGMLPCYKYPGSQDWLMGMNKDHYKRVYAEYESLKAKWILVNHKSKTGEVKIVPVLNAHYEPVMEKGKFILYKSKD